MTNPLTPKLYNRLSQLQANMKWTNARTLLAKMTEHAESDSEYAVKFAEVIHNGGTVKLRELAEPFGGYWGNLKVANAIDGIDATFCKV